MCDNCFDQGIGGIAWPPDTSEAERLAIQDMMMMTMMITSMIPKISRGLSDLSESIGTINDEDDDGESDDFDFSIPTAF